MDSDAEGTPSEFFDYFKVINFKSFLILASGATVVVIYCLHDLFRFCAFKVFLLAVSMQSV